MKKKVCYTCNGSGVYDNAGSPPCGACNGKGYIIEHPDNMEPMTDAQFDSVLSRLKNSYEVYIELLERAKHECDRRYGVIPGNLEDGVTVAELEEDYGDD